MDLNISPSMTLFISPLPTYRDRSLCHIREGGGGLQNGQGGTSSITPLKMGVGGVEKQDEVERGGRGGGGLGVVLRNYLFLKISYVCHSCDPSRSEKKISFI